MLSKLLQLPYQAPLRNLGSGEMEELGIGGGTCDLALAHFLRDHCGGDPVPRTKEKKGELIPVPPYQR